MDSSYKLANPESVALKKPNPNRRDDEKQLDAANSSSWLNVWQSHRNWLTSVLYSRLRDQHAVDEVMQETALAASKNCRFAENDVRISKWLYRVAIRQALLYRRRMVRNHRRIESFGAETSTLVNETQNPVQLLIASENRQQVQQALMQLAKKDCEVLLLKYRDGWNCQQMAERLGASESAMKSRLLRARRNLMAKLRKLGVGEDAT